MKQLLRNLVGPRILNAWRMWGKRPVAAAKEVFTACYQNNHWADDESVSGLGSSPKETQRIQKLLPWLFREFDIRTFLDAPCGNFAWIQHVYQSHEDARAGISNIRAGRPTCLLTTTHPGTLENLPMLTGGFRPLDLQRYPINFPEPLQFAFERSDAGFADTNKALGLRRIEQLR